MMDPCNSSNLRSQVPAATIFSGLLILLVCGCTSVTTETPKSIDFSGTWRVNESNSDPVPDINKIFSEERNAIISGELNEPTNSATFLKLDFPILFNNVLMIEQDAESMGINYESSPYDDIKWGLQSHAGWRRRVVWKENTLVIQKNQSFSPRD